MGDVFFILRIIAVIVLTVDGGLVFFGIRIPEKREIYGIILLMFAMIVFSGTNKNVADEILVGINEIQQCSCEEK